MTIYHDADGHSAWKVERAGARCWELRQARWPATKDPTRHEPKWALVLEFDTERRAVAWKEKAERCEHGNRVKSARYERCLDCGVYL